MQDIIGKKFYALLAIREVSKGKKIGYEEIECLCDCGNKINIKSRYLKEGVSKSCGCGLFTKSDLRKTRFGMLLVTDRCERTESHKKYGTKWKCVCDCGNICEFYSNDLKSGRKYNCGCFRKIKTIDMSGKTINFLKVKNLFSSGSGNRIWECECICGNILYAKTGQITQGRIRSCGCKTKQYNWKGYGAISGEFWTRIKSAAKSRNLDIQISIEYIWDLYLKQNGKCALTGLDIFFADDSVKYRTGYSTASLDRIDSSKGYIEGNVQWLHKTINIMKMDLPMEEFIKLCSQVTKYNEK